MSLQRSTEPLPVESTAIQANSPPSRNRVLQVGLFFTLLLASAALANPPIALLLGFIIGLSVKHPFPKANSATVKRLLQYSVIGLGFGIHLDKVIQASQTGVIMAIITILTTLGLGFLLGKALKINTKTAYLISAGTAICGGSAIAAVGPVLDADDREMSVSLGTIFILNGIALLVFPTIGHAMGLSQGQFGLWSAIAIHDTSSVVGAAAKYGNEALMIATTVKLARALWIVPLVFLTAWLFHRNSTEKKSSKVALPYFILFFLLTSVLQTYVPPVAAVAPWLTAMAKLGLTITLFLIGAGLSLDALRSVGVKPLIFGLLLWLVVAGLSLWGIHLLSA